MQSCVGLLAFYLDRILSRPDLPRASQKAEKGKGPTIALIPAALQQHLGCDERAPRTVYGNRQLIRDRTMILCLPIVHLEPDRILDTHRTQTLKAAALLPVARSFDTDRKAVRHESEGIK